MQNISKLVIFKIQNEHDLEHDLKHKKQYSLPKIYDANGDLSKRWYIYFSYRNPETGKLQRIKNIYGKTNQYKTKADRYTILNLYKKRLSLLLKEGFNPFIDNTYLYNKYNKNQNSNLNLTKTPILVNDKPQPNYNQNLINEAFDYVIKLKENLISKSTLSDYVNRSKNFISWLVENHKDIKYTDQLTKKIISDFLNDIQLNTSARNRNNYRACLSSLFQLMMDEELIKENYLTKIKPLKTKPKKNKRFSIEEQEMIFNFLEEEDPILLLYIKFISYTFLRPIEVNRLKIKDLNLNENTFQFKAKNSPLKTKIIPKILLKDLPDLTKFNNESVLFTPQGIGKNWETDVINRRDFFSKKFKKIVKDHFGFDANYGLYSFRHTYITKLYRALEKEFSPHEAKSRLMQITGHSSMSALEKYLREIDARLPKDYSKLL